MKIRTGHVSNSSTSSFVCRLDGLSQEQKDILTKMVEDHNAEAYDGYLWISSNGQFIIGDAQHSILDMSLLKEANIPQNYYAHEC